MTSTRLTERFRRHLADLRSDIAQLPDSPMRESIAERLDYLGRDLAYGFPVTEEVDPELEAERDAAGITGLLDDTCGQGNSDRDHRNHDDFDAENSAA